MPEYRAPGVYVEEAGYRAKTIEGVETAVADFVGLTRYGPVGGEPEPLKSFADFGRIYGGLEPLDNGRLVCLVGVAVVKPAEFVIFSIGQWTADRKD